MSFFGDISAGAVGGLLGGIGTLIKDIREAVVGAEMKPEQKVALELKVMELEQAATNAQMEMIRAEASSADPWTSRARPSFMYIFYIILLTCGLLAPAIGIYRTQEMSIFFANISLGFKAIPDNLYGLFGVGYLGYTGFRTFEKVKGVSK